jgi:very-short-patch-repair endonuclease
MANSKTDPEHNALLESILESWRRELIDPTRRNRLLAFTPLKVGSAEIDLDHTEASRLFDGLHVGDKWEFHRPPEVSSAADDTDVESDFDDVTLDLTPAEVTALDGVVDPNKLVLIGKTAGDVQKTLRRLATASVQEEQDKGIWILYLAFGFLRWIDPEFKDEYLSPLTLVPVTIARETRRDPYKLYLRDGDVEFNPALRVRLGEFGVEFSAEAGDHPDLWSMVSSIVADVRDKVAGQPSWVVEERAVIATFAFQKEVMYRDLEVNHEAVAGHGLIRRLALGAGGAVVESDILPPSDDRLDDFAPPEESVTVLEADASQRACIALARSGASFVIDGPPGTGKSQTITNVIASTLGAGKTVLFVSEKAAALEVVHNRLIGCGLGDFVLAAHSARASRREVAQSLQRELTVRPSVRRELGDDDIATLRQSREYLTNRANAMHEIREPLNRSLSEAIGLAATLIDVPQAPNVDVVTASYRPDQYAAVMTAAAQLGRAWGPVEGLSDFVWKGLKPDVYDQRWADVTRAQIATARDALGEFNGVVEEFADRISMPIPTTVHELEDLSALGQVFARVEGVSPRWLVDAGTMSPLVEGFIGHLEELASTRAIHGRDLVLTDGDAADCLRSLNALIHGGQAAVPDDVKDSRERAIARPEQIRILMGDVENVARAVSEISVHLGVSLEDPGLAKLRVLLDLAILTSTEDRPDVAWLTPSKVSSLRSALERIRSAVQAEEAAATPALAFFAPSVLSIEIGALAERLAAASQQSFRALRGGFRDSRRELLAHGQAGKDFDTLRSQIDLALAWKAAAERVDACIAESRELFGEHFVISRETDFDRVGRAVDTAERVLELCGSDIEAGIMGPHIGAGTSEDPRIVSSARSVDGILSGLASRCGEIAGIELAEISTMGIGEISDALAAVSTSAERLEVLFKDVAHARHVPELQRALESQARIDQIRIEIAGHQSALEEALDGVFDGERTNVEAVRAALAAVTLAGTLATGAFSSSGAEALLVSMNDEDRSDLRDSGVRWAAAVSAISSQFDDHTSAAVAEELRSTIVDVAALLDALRDQVKDVREWLDFVQAKADLEALGFASTIGVCEREGVGAGDVERVVERAMLESWIDDVLSSEPRLSDLNRNNIHPWVERFQQLDRRIKYQSVWQVIDACVKRRPSDSFRSGEYQVIEREGMKKTRHMPVRTLLEKAGSAAQALKPCFMMSPLTVSQFLPASLTFDVVIFDEASQVPPADALTSIYRGKQLIVAGDQLQLPPTRFFSGGLGEEDVWVEDEPDAFESILDAAKATGGFPSNRLRWHYRSEHEDLITYSNYAIYDGELTTFPGVRQTGEDLGVEQFFVPDGLYEGRGRNPIEAQRVAERVIWWAERNRANPSEARTVGVVAMSRAHADDIDEAIYRLRRDREDLDSFFVEDRLAGFFVKNLENVQGDERDVMILSVGYGPDQNGEIKMNFGPISQAMGKRRLNVAITRAKSRVEVFTSLDHAKIRVTSEETGTRHLKGYLAFAEQGAKALELEIRRGPSGTESPFEDSVLETVRRWGYTAHTQVGSSGYRIDIGICDPADPARYILGVECDGAQYHSAKTARDRDRLRQEVLERRGWTIHRIWGTDWYRYRDAAEEALRRAIEGRIGEPRDVKPLAHDDGAIEIEHEPVGGASPGGEFPHWAVPYATVIPKIPGGKTNADISDTSQRARVTEMVREVLDGEGPIHREALATRVREGWGLQRTTKKVSETTFKAATRLVRAGNALRDGDFFYTSEEQLGVARLPKTGDVGRVVSMVHESELKAALRAIVDQAHSIEHDELTRVCAGCFGWARRGPGISVALDGAVQQLLEDGAVIRGPDGLYRIRQ